MPEPGDAEEDDHQDLGEGRDDLKGPPKPQVEGVQGSRRQDRRDGDGHGVHRQHRRQVTPECHGRQGDGGGEAHRHRDPASELAKGRVVDAGQETVLTAGTWQGGGELRIGQGTAQGHQAPEEPEQEECRPVPHALGLEAKRREDPGPDHVGDHDQDGRTVVDEAMG